MFLSDVMQLSLHTTQILLILSLRKRTQSPCRLLTVFLEHRCLIVPCLLPNKAGTSCTALKFCTRKEFSLTTGPQLCPRKGYHTGAIHFCDQSWGLADSASNFVGVLYHMRVGHNFISPRYENAEPTDSILSTWIFISEVSTFPFAFFLALGRLNFISLFLKHSWLTLLFGFCCFCSPPTLFLANNLQYSFVTLWKLDAATVHQAKIPRKITVLR